MKMTLQEFEQNGGCEGCLFYVEVEPGRKECSFHWFDDDCEVEKIANHLGYNIVWTEKE